MFSGRFPVTAARRVVLGNIGQGRGEIRLSAATATTRSIVRSKPPLDEQNPVLTRVKAMLSSTDPGRWMQFADSLDVDFRFPKKRESWERLYALEITGGILALRSSQKVRSNYYSGGYALSPIGPEIYTVEIRSRAWNPKALVDEYHSSAHTNSLPYQTLIEGEDARELFSEIANVLADYASGRQERFLSEIEEILEKIMPVLDGMSSESWEKYNDPEGNVEYKGRIGDLSVVCRKMRNGNYITHSLIFSNEEFSTEGSYGTTAAAVFEHIDGLSRDAALLAFSQVLEEMGK